MRFYNIYSMIKLWHLVLLLFVTYSEQSSGGLKEVQKLISPSYFAKAIQEALLDQDSTCAKQIVEYSKGLLSGKLWALSMFDATGKLPSGLLEGNVDLGSFDECLKATPPKKHNFTAKYCINGLDRGLAKRFEDSRSTNNSEPEDSGIVTLLSILKQAVCVPSGCSAKDLNSLFEKIVGFYPAYTDEGCQTKESAPKLGSGAIATISFFGTILAIMMVSTIYDAYYHYSDRDPSHLILTSFSILSNGKKLLSKSKSPDAISCLHGIRVLSLIWVVLGHTYSMQTVVPIKNLVSVLEWLGDVRNMFLIGATVSVDTFFLASGLTLSYSYLVYKRKGNKFNLLLFYIHRYLRLTPAFAALILFIVMLLQHCGSGPFWQMTISFNSRPCETNWWKALLYIQSYTQMDICVGQSWYLSVDTQLYVLSPIILLPLGIWPKTALVGTGILTALSIISCFLTGWFYELNGQVIGNASAEKMKNYFQYYYNATHTRAAVWLIGILYGYVIFRIKNNKRTFLMPKGIVVIMWLVSFAVLGTCLFAGNDLIFQEGNFNRPYVPLNKLENSFYLALVRPAWGIAIGWIVVACVTGYDGGPVNWFLSLHAFEVLAKLSYTMYLVHFFVMSVYLGQIRTSLVFSNFNQIYLFWGHFGFTTMFSLLLYMGIEYPFAVIEQQLIRKFQGNTNNSPVEKNVQQKH